MYFYIFLLYKNSSCNHSYSEDINFPFPNLAAQPFSVSPLIGFQAAMEQDLWGYRLSGISYFSNIYFLRLLEWPF